MLSYYQITTKKIALAIQIILLKISLLVATFAFCFSTLQTVQTKVSLDLIWIQTIWHYDGISEKKYFKIVQFEKCHAQKACIITKELI